MALNAQRPPEASEGRGNMYPLLRQTPLRKFVSDSQLKELEGFCERRVRSPGTTLYRQGDRADQLFIVVTGSVELRARPPGETGLPDGGGGHGGLHRG